jgi:broad specificity phosphatase PhoE
MSIVYAVRHCENKNPDKLLVFKLRGYPLSDAGKAQADKLAKYFSGKKLTAIYSSPLERAVDTAETIAKYHKEVHVSVSELIHEVSSPLQGKFLSAFVDTESLCSNRVHVEGDGEMPQQMYDRMNRFLLKKLKIHGDETFLFVSHGDPLAYLVAGLKDIGMTPISHHDTDMYITRGNAWRLVFDGSNFKSAEMLKIQSAAR